MALNFPNSPAANDTFSGGGKTWVYNGTRWVLISSGSVDVTPADGSVTAAKIADGTIVAAEIANSAITTAKILDANVTAAKIASDAVTTAKIAEGAVTAAKINNAVTLNDIPDVTITSASSGQVLQWNGTAWVNAIGFSGNKQAILSSQIFG